MKENFAIKLRELRKASGMTQEQLAAEFGVSVQAVSKWETAASYPDIELMPRIADLFGVSLDELLRDELHIPVFVADNALRCVAEGTGILLENLHLVK